MLLLEIEKVDLPLFSEAIDHPSSEIEVIETDNLDASGIEIIKILVPLTTAAIGAISTVVVTMINSRKNIRIKKDGIEITGVTAENAMKILERLSE